MNRKWIVPVFAAAAAGVLAFGVTRHAACRAAGPGIDRLRDASFLVRELGLNDAQAQTITDLHTTLGAKLTECCARHCTARARLGETLADETNGVARAEAVLKDMCRAYEEIERTTLDHIRQVRALLDARQRERFDKMLAECLCRSCPLCQAPRDDAKPEGGEEH